MRHLATAADRMRRQSLVLAAVLHLTVAVPGKAATGVSAPPAPAMPGRSAFARSIGLAIGAGRTTITQDIRPGLQGGIADWFARGGSAKRGAGDADAAGDIGGSSIAADAESEPAGGDTVPTLFAGVAYEVRAVGANGTSTAVDAATHLFHTGDRFMLLVRPSLPGQMEVYNINATGRQTRIDSSRMAAGQLSSLGPYEFAASTGDEALRLVFSACSTPALLAATRDIVKVSAAPSGATAAIALAECAAGGPASGAAHDIDKISRDGSTSFALDPVSADERNSGAYVPREVMVVFHHR